jgi:hypothetical protein
MANKLYLRNEIMLEEEYEEFDKWLIEKSEENQVKSQQIDYARDRVEEYQRLCVNATEFRSSYDRINAISDEMHKIDTLKDELSNRVDRGLQYHWNHESTKEVQIEISISMQEAIQLSDLALSYVRDQTMELCRVLGYNYSDPVFSAPLAVTGEVADPMNDHSA